MSKPAGTPALRRPTVAEAGPARRPTMRDIAALVGVHQTTVSLALRHHPSIPASTRDRIRAAADRLGYRPNPLLSAFNFHRVAAHPVKGAPALAMIFDGRMQPRSGLHEYPRRLYEAARAAATQRGYLLESFVLEEDGLNARRLNRVLAARGISGAILCTLALDTPALELDWTRLSAVKIESRHAAPALDTVSSDQWQATRIALRRMRELGYGRIGLVAAVEDEARLGEPFRTGMLVEQAAMPRPERVPPLLFSRGDPGLGPALIRWARARRVDAVVSNWNNIIDLVRAQGVHVPGDLAIASLDLPRQPGELAGVVQNHALVGRRAVEQVVMLLQTHQRGVPEMPSVTFVPGRWLDGRSAPAK